jgi:serine/threonine-protein kinase
MNTTSGFTGTIAYCSPERFQDNPNSDKEDSWALGVVLYLLATLELPFSKTNPNATMYSIINDNIRPIQNRSQDLVDLINVLLQKNPANRPTIKDVLIDSHFLYDSIKE